MTHPTRKTFTLLVLVLLSIRALASAAEPAPGAAPRERPIDATSTTAPLEGGTTAKPKEKSAFDRLWAVPVLYKDTESDFLNEFRFVGRFHGDFYNADSNLGHDSDWIVRRVRIGAKAQLFHKLTAHVEVDFDPQNDNPSYSRLTDAYLAWTFSDAAKLTVGKQSVRFTLDGSVSSNELLTIERNNLSNNLWFPSEYSPGVSLSGKRREWAYFTGVFSGGSESPEFGNFDAGNFGIVSLGYDFGKTMGVKRALIRADYVYNQRDPESTITRSLENIGSLVFVLDAGKWGFSADASAATGYGSQSNLYGAVAMPWFNITKNLQVVGRYTFVTSEDLNDVRLTRYESFQTRARGDEYHDFYAGLNYYIHGHKLKVQTGLTYTSMRDRSDTGGNYEGWTWTSAVRLSF